jgi:hypothetical protein
MAAAMLDESTDKISVEYEKQYDIKSFETKLENLKKFVTDIKGYPSITGKREMYKSITEGITEDAEIAGTINNEIDTADVSESIVNNAALEALMRGSTKDNINNDGNSEKKGMRVVPDNNQGP